MDEEVEEIADYLAALNMQLALLDSRRRRRMLAEVEDHLRQATNDHAAGGGDRRVAANAAIARFGPPGAVAGRVVGRHWAVRWEALRRAHPAWTRAVVALACGGVAAAQRWSNGHALDTVRFGVALAAVAFAGLVVMRPLLTRAAKARLDAGRSGPDRSLPEALATMAGAAVVPLLALVGLRGLGQPPSTIAPALVVASTAVILPGLTIVMSGGGTGWQVRVRLWRFQHPWAWGGAWGGLTVLFAVGLSSWTMPVALPAAAALAAMHGCQAMQATADHIALHLGDQGRGSPSPE